MRISGKINAKRFSKTGKKSLLTSNDAEKKYKALFEQSPFGILLIDTEGKILDFNETAHRDLGYTREEFANITIADIDPVESAADVKSRISRILEKGMAEFETRHRSKQGEIRDVHVITKALALSGQTLLHSIWRDITESKRAEEMLRETNARLGTLIQAMPDMVFLKDAEGRCVMVNRFAEECFGQNQGWFIGKTNNELMPPDTAEMCNRSDAEAIRKSRAINAEEQFFDKEGRIQFLDSIKAPIYNSNGTLSGLLCVARDITERKRAEEALQQSEERLRLAMSGANDGLWDWNLQTDEVYYSPRWQSMLGYAEEELEHNLDTWKRLVHPDDRERTLVAVNDLLEGRADKFEVEFRMQHKDGHYLSILSRAFLAHDTEGKVLRLVGTHVDITERKRAEEQIETSLREKEILLKEIHHRVKNNLNVIASLLSLQSRYITEQAVVGIFEECRNRINSMALIHEKLYQTKNFSKIDFKDYLNSLISMISSSYIHMRDKVSMITDIQDLSLDIDTAMTCGLVTNELVTNCLKHAFPENRGGEINIRLFSESGKHILSVGDNGIGLPDRFDLMNTNTLGLQMVNMLTRQLEGTMHVAVNSGTEIRISF